MARPMAMDLAGAGKKLRQATFFLGWLDQIPRDMPLLGADPEPLEFFGGETLIAEVTAQQIARYDSHRLTQTSRLKRLLSPASVNRALATLRHLLRLAEEWGYIVKAPRIRLGREPEGRLRFLNEEEAARLLVASAARPGSSCGAGA